MNELFNKITLTDALNEMVGRPGLVLGPGLSLDNPGFKAFLDQVKQSVGSKASHFSVDAYASQLDALKNSDPVSAREFERAYRDELQTLPVGLDIPYLSQAPWSMCISLTQDLVFEGATSEYLDTVMGSKAVAIVDSLRHLPQRRVFPIYKLLGHHLNTELDGGLALSESEVYRRKSIWGSLLKTSADYLKAAPLFFVGTDCAESLTKDLLTVLSTTQAPNPSALVFLKGDPILQDHTVVALCNSFSKIYVVDASLREFCKGVISMPPKQRSLNLGTTNVTTPSLFSKFSNIVSVVPSEKLSDSDFQNHRLAILDGLFRPTSLDWTPFQCGIDIERDINQDIVQSTLDVIGPVKAGAITNTILVRGNAGVGKSTVLKKTSFELSQQGVTVLWCHRASATHWAQGFRKLSKELSDHAKDNPDEKFVFYFDDPWALRINPGEMLSCFDKCSANVAFIFSFRNSDYFNPESSAYSLPGVPADDFEVPITLSDVELVNLTSCLVVIGAAVDETFAKRLVAGVPSNNSEDILCSLWFLIPETKGSIEESLRDEYLRLGECSSIVEDLASDASLSQSAKNAYELVVVASNLGISIPLEILVRALQIDYAEFIDMTSEKKNLWGLIYAEEDDDNETIVYWARNQVVIKVLLKLINGGVGHGGEFRALKRLVEACDVGSKLYKEFLISILVRSRNTLEKILNYDQGVELYDLALQAVGNDKRFHHQKGVWMQHVGKNYPQAYQQLEKALNTPNDPSEERSVLNEHIHSSMGSVVVQMVKHKEQDPETGLNLVIDHVQQSHQGGVLDTYASHISANNLFEFGSIQCANDERETGFLALVQALQELENTIVSIGPAGSASPKFVKSVSMLSELYERVLDAVPEDLNLSEFAEQLLLEKGSQVGYELMIWKSLANITRKRGGEYNKVRELIDSCVEAIESQGISLSPLIVSARVDLVIRWRLQMRDRSVDWVAFNSDLELLLALPRFREDVTKMFYHAVALFHLDQVDVAQAIFSNIRRIRPKGYSLGDIRCVFIGKEGAPKRFQCYQERKHQASYVTINELQTETHLGPGWQQGSGSCYVGFSLRGPLALSEKPEPESLLLA